MQLAQLYCSFGSRFVLYFEIESMAVSPEALNEIQAALKQAKEGQLVQACHKHSQGTIFLGAQSCCRMKLHVIRRTEMVLG